MKLTGKVALVTGTSPNIGGGIAEGLAAEGAAIVAVDANAANARDCAAYIKSIGGVAQCFHPKARSGSPDIGASCACPIDGIEVPGTVSSGST